MNKGDKVVLLSRKIKRNSYPKVRMICGQVQRIRYPHAAIERLKNDRWQAM